MKNQHMIRLIAISSLLSVGMVLVRIIFSGSDYYWFMVWNLFLAWIPLVISQTMMTLQKRKQKRFVVSLFFLWIVFIPNAPYMITDFIHLTPRNGVPLLLDGLLLCAFAVLGIAIGLYSMMNIDQLIGKNFGWSVAKKVEIALLLLISLGVMMGRIFRWNSWDVLFSPTRLFSETMILLHSASLLFRIFSWSMALFFFLFFLNTLLKHLINSKN